MLQIPFLRGISWWWKVGKKLCSLIFWKYGGVNEFYGAIDISFQLSGAEFLVIRGLEKLKLWNTGTWKSTSTRHATLKSTLLLQFPYCELCYNDNKQSNYRLMNVCSVQEPYLPTLANLQSNKRQKKETLRFSHRFFASMHLSKCEIFHSYERPRNFFTFFSFLDQSPCMKS